MRVKRYRYAPQLEFADGGLMPFSFSEAERLIATMENIAPDRRGALNSRLKQWQKLGMPDGVNVGRGKRAAYGAKQLYQLALMIRLLKAGVTPDRASSVILDQWMFFRGAIVATLQAIAAGNPDPLLVLIRLNALSEITAESGDTKPLLIPLHQSVLGKAVGKGKIDLPGESDEEYAQVWKFFIRLALSGSVVIDMTELQSNLAVAAEDAKLDLRRLQPELGGWAKAFSDKWLLALLPQTNEEWREHIANRYAPDRDMVRFAKGIFGVDS